MLSLTNYGSLKQEIFRATVNRGWKFFLDKNRDGLAIIESKSKVRYSRSRAIEPRVSTNAPLSTSTPSNSFEFQQMAALLEDKMNIRMSRLEKAISEKQSTPATVKAVEEPMIQLSPEVDELIKPRGGHFFSNLLLNSDPSPSLTQGNYLLEIKKELKLCKFAESSIDEHPMGELRTSTSSRNGNF
ncbi:hypothetical protein Tco_1136101 [Tanacetum coccineum]